LATKKTETAKTNETPEELTFQCEKCRQYKPIEDMRVVKRFFPMPVVCSECEEKLR
jgi:hypothetical protein